ncbi:hypothetical protein SDRG_11348 [Saprolegnia diclina VS20]|uniref:MARVEL domain-containing protein n=1 Tax=Saprolegnia diclina (strain VS20) TaxID=1156394 RepID=T0RLK0_SAPDV|nr:hypothetical protein SDRG_11348 [Saprolegnia diclina VS20]EQC30867.1 hypothetical protein SDRG_11348 [Saprolegnia diclina VS20]|eukprot:XP_008615605.1 hypothetical protein SDRG_11348 [Saprolegnia diclina VS20]
MPKPTRTTVAVAIAFVVVAAYGACVVALDASMYGALIVMPHAIGAAITAIVIAALGLMHLVWTRLVPSPTFCLVLLILEVVCASVLLGLAVNGVAKTTSAIETAPALTTYQHRMETFFASDKAPQFNYTDSLWSSNAFHGPSNPMYRNYDDAAVAIASGVALFCLLLLAARVWVVRRAKKYQDALRDATVQSPVDNA